MALILFVLIACGLVALGIWRYRVHRLKKPPARKSARYFSMTMGAPAERQIAQSMDSTPGRSDPRD